MDILGETKIDFLGLRKITFIFSGVFIALGLIAMGAIVAGKANMGTDFTGGVQVQLARFAFPVELNDDVVPFLAGVGS